jgi:hypothetical protein
MTPITYFRSEVMKTSTALWFLSTKNMTRRQQEKRREKNSKSTLKKAVKKGRATVGCGRNCPKYKTMLSKT